MTQKRYRKKSIDLSKPNGMFTKDVYCMFNVVL